MGNTHDFADFEDYATTLIRCKVRQLITQLGFDVSEREEMEQEIAADLYYRLRDYNTDRGAVKTFIVCVVNNKVRTIIQVRNKRTSELGGPVVSLNETFIDDDGYTCELVDALDREDCLLRAGLLSRQTLELNEMRIDIERVLADLPRPLQEICERLKDAQNVTNISEATGKSRQQVYEAIRKIRKIFSKASFEDYL